MRSVITLLAVLLAAAVSGCEIAPGQPGATGAGRDGTTVALAPDTCWTNATLGSDPQVLLSLSGTYGVNYFDAARALAARPSFALTEACDGEHHVEVYQVLPINQIQPLVTNYATLLLPSSTAYGSLSAAVARACMSPAAVRAADQTGIAGSIVEPAFPDGVLLGWAPPSPDQWNRGQRVYACTLMSASAVRYRYAAVFTRAFPTGDRTCIDNASRIFVDCARKHDRERIAVIDVRAAVAAGRFPGTTAIRTGSAGRYVDVPANLYAALDRGCTSYLRAVSTTRRLTGIAEIDADTWPSADGSYPVYCEADTPTTTRSIVTEGSVYNRS